MPARLRAIPATLTQALVVVLTTATLAACSSDGRELRPPSPDQTASIVTSSTTGPVTTPVTIDPIDGPAMSLPWVDGTAIPVDYTCQGLDVSPGIAWSALPTGTVEVAIVMTESTGFVHWVVAGLDPLVGQVSQGGVPEEAVQSRNDFGTTGYQGPCPIAGTGVHQYFVTVYALRETSNLVDGGDPAEAIRRLDEVIVASSTMVGTFGEP
jgi:Raf kinase inhibitor-like YbhB/YbcL family protein